MQKSQDVNATIENKTSWGEGKLAYNFIDSVSFQISFHINLFSAVHNAKQDDFKIKLALLFYPNNFFMGEEWQNGKDSPIAMGHPEIPKRNNFLSLKKQPHLKKVLKMHTRARSSCNVKPIKQEVQDRTSQSKGRDNKNLKYYLHFITIFQDLKLFQILFQLQWSWLKLRIYLQKLCIITLVGHEMICSVVNVQDG